LCLSPGMHTGLHMLTCRTKIESAGIWVGANARNGCGICIGPLERQTGPGRRRLWRSCALLSLPVVGHLFETAMDL